jgi:hypothetical protein
MQLTNMTNRVTLSHTRLLISIFVNESSCSTNDRSEMNRTRETRQFVLAEHWPRSNGRGNATKRTHDILGVLRLLTVSALVDTKQTSLVVREDKQKHANRT